VTEQPNGQISFFSLAVHVDGNLKLQELNDRIVGKEEAEYDPV